MALIVETGSGVAAADSYAAISAIDAYWLARPHNALSAIWSAAEVGIKDGAAREATGYIDGLYGPHYRGERKDYVQGLMWPRTGAVDDANIPLPDLPPELVAACCELAARAIGERLSPDSDTTAPVISESIQVGPYKEETKYGEGASLEQKFGGVAGRLAPILDGTQPGSPSGSWFWR